MKANYVEINANTEPSIKIANRLDEGAETRPEETITANSALEEYIWLACALDSEGTVWLRHNGRGVGFQFGLEIVNTCPRYIEKVCKIMKPFNAGTYIKKPSGLGKKIAYRVFVKGFNALELCKKLSPYLTTKKEFVDILISFYSNRIKNSRWSKNEIDEMSRIRDLFIKSRSS